MYDEAGLCQRVNEYNEEWVSSMFRVVKNAKRRRLLLEMWRNGGFDTDITTLRGAFMRNPMHETSREMRKEHLPYLEEMGLIEWNRETGEIKQGPNFDDVTPFLDRIDDLLTDE